MSARAQELELELVHKRKEVIDLTAELDRAKRVINSLEYLQKEDGNLMQAQINAIEELEAERDRAERQINGLQRSAKEFEAKYLKLHNLKEHAEDMFTQSNEAWKEKVDYLEEQLAINQINQWYLKPLFLFAAGFATSTVVISFAVRYL